MGKMKTPMENLSTTADNPTKLSNRVYPEYKSETFPLH